MIPVLDVFAGPGGLGEGFSAFRDVNGKQRFELALSLEKDVRAHETLRLRSLQRRVNAEGPNLLDEMICGGKLEWSELSRRHPRAAASAEAEARCVELGPRSVEATRELIKSSIRTDGPWILIGGPPCQAYSLVGRARNKGVAGYETELDHRQTLYVEYLQIVADHAPPLFVMENVKGILSAQFQSQQLFKRILDDLADPSKALAREGRATVGPAPKYSIRTVATPADPSDDDPSRYVVRSELFGIPQRRHRVILIGVRTDVTGVVHPLKRVRSPKSVTLALKGLPSLRSGLSKEADSDELWLAQMRSVAKKPWLKLIDYSVASHIRSVSRELAVPDASRGAECMRHRKMTIFNHSSRSHIALDLERYFFASVFAAVNERSPILADFPEELLPKHENVSSALGNGLFADRFRVQLAEAPSTTITSHISKDGHYYIHPDPAQCRSFTVREAARLQTFPDDYFFCGPRTSQYHQVGNAVPPKLAEKIVGCIAGLLGI